jgi:hypothetical protein
MALLTDPTHQPTNMETIKHGNLTIKVTQDDYPGNPREWDNVGKMVCWHRRYILGDEQPTRSPEEYLADLMAGREYKLHGKWVPEDIDRKHVQSYINKHFFILPLYLYDHSGISMSAAPFNCPWDSGQVGFIYAERNCDEYPDLRAGLLAEVKTYNQYLTGDIFNYDIEDEDGNVVDSCCGFYGFDDCKQAATEAAESIANNLATSFCI